MKCRLLHRWVKNLYLDTSLYSIIPVAGTRTCARCGKHQRYFNDSQGGCWITVKPDEAKP